MKYHKILIQLNLPSRGTCIYALIIQSNLPASSPIDVSKFDTAKTCFVTCYIFDDMRILKTFDCKKQEISIHKRPFNIFIFLTNVKISHVTRDVCLRGGN